MDQEQERDHEEEAWQKANAEREAREESAAEQGKQVYEIEVERIETFRGHIIAANLDEALRLAQEDVTANDGRTGDMLFHACEELNAYTLRKVTDDLLA